jgi:hypothetical protein
MVYPFPGYGYEYELCAAPLVGQRGHDLPYEVCEIKGRHDEDGHPGSEAAARYLGLDAGEEAEGDQVGEGDGGHVGPDDTDDRKAGAVAVCIKIWGFVIMHF